MPASAPAPFALSALATQILFQRRLGVLGVGQCVVALVLVRNPFGLFFVVLLGAVFLLVALRVPHAPQIVVILLAVQLAPAVFSRSDYLFTRTARTAAGPMPSDVARMAEVLFLPYWFWGSVCGALSVVILWLGFRVFFRCRLSSVPARVVSAH